MDILEADLKNSFEEFIHQKYSQYQTFYADDLINPENQRARFTSEAYAILTYKLLSRIIILIKP